MDSNKKRLTNKQSGQVALFVALIFQVLFVFFAMVINVGLLVHHKINLQNSVDLAAYYGAARQAEMMNAVSHVNYQIRQAYKLLMFRYHQVGSAGENREHPFDNRAGQMQIRNENDELSKVPTAFCLAYRPHSIVQADETYCKDLQNLVIPKPESPDLVGGTAYFFTIQESIRQATETLRNQLTRQCQVVGQQNYFALARFIAAYKSDVANRKKLLIKLANKISEEEPSDLDGQSVRLGVYKTLLKNLTLPNSDSIRSVYGDQGMGSGNANVQFEFLNGLSQGNCGLRGAEWEPPGWLAEVLIFPYLRYLEADCAGNSAVSFTAKPISMGNDSSSPRYRTILDDDLLEKIRDIVNEPTGDNAQTRLFKSSLGFEKNPWCMAYVGVKAKATPRIPFTPLGSVTLEAQAYAKPFGGKIGPWYGTTWQAGQPRSFGETRDTKTDILAPFRVDIGGITIDPNDPNNDINFSPNNARYWRDEFGQRSNLTMAHSAQAIHAIDKIDFMWWEHLFDDDMDNLGTSGDPLAWDKETSQAPPIRDLELASIAPDHFDLTQYSIEPDFHDNYLIRIKKGYEGEFNFAMRPDLGGRLLGGDDKMRRFNIRHQIEHLNDTQKNPLDVQTKLRYYLLDFAGLLTSWQGKSNYDYSLDTERFGKCDSEGVIKDDIDINFKTSGMCFAGGRTGYSVKIVDGNYLRRPDLELGGRGVSGAILNSPP